MNQKRVVLPTFLIVGAAKAGTSSVFHYLKEHPEVHTSNIKETFYFNNFDFNSINRSGGAYWKKPITTLNEYKKLFLSSFPGIRASGEASTSYLPFYLETIPRIKNTLGDPKIIIILRNPVDRAFSNYLHHKRDGFEQFSFEQALKLEEQRVKENWWCTYQLRAWGFYYESVKAYIENFSNVKVSLYDDLKSDPKQFIKNIYRFIGVDSDFKPELQERYNASNFPKIKWLWKITDETSKIRKTSAKMAGIIVNKKNRQMIIRYLKNINSFKPRMNEQTRKMLIGCYHEDIQKTSSLIHRDLSHWIEN